MTKPRTAQPVWRLNDFILDGLPRLKTSNYCHPNSVSLDVRVAPLQIVGKPIPGSSNILFGRWDVNRKIVPPCKALRHEMGFALAA
ncbi:MAG TPA: hypothetical protein VNV82_00275 [Bryobacteraceae bacterium]|nr:hypothetical protein [Bryobacteraceae bacterium]